MNRKQKICLWIGISVIVLMGLFPPVARRRHSFISERSTTYVEYEFILDTSSQVVLSNLITQWFIVSAITGGLIYIFNNKKQKDETSKDKQKE